MLGSIVCFFLDVFLMFSSWYCRVARCTREVSCDIHYFILNIKGLMVDVER